MRRLLAFAACSLATPLFAASHTVNVGPGVSYSPATLTIALGDTVRFRNRGGLHNVVADDLSFRCARGCDGTGGNGAPSSDLWFVDIVFNQLGEVGYYCEQHGSPTDGMRGTIVVLPSTPVDLQSFTID
ncbi:hypothetical protein [Dokdonella sp.]|uniref:cupredoxin domain-containing protein n=1 Tax=Dokdonella sp. TaxID=2291710 RepID=UPI003783059E